MDLTEPLFLGPRRFGAVNWRGLWSLYRRDVVRFLRYASHSLGGPAVSSLLFFAVFVLALGSGRQMAPGVPLDAFIAPGILLFGMIHGTFGNMAMIVIYDKQEGIIADILGAPLSPAEIVVAYILAATTNGLMTGAVIFGLMSIFNGIAVHAAATALGFAVAAVLLFALIGLLVGLWAQRWDHYSAVDTLLILPIGLLSGAFFSLEQVPAAARVLFEINPVFHAVNGIRFGFTGHSDADIGVGAAFLGVLIPVLGLLAWRLIATGYRLKA